VCTTLFSSDICHSRFSIGPVRRLFAKAGYNIALISRESDNLHKFAAELKTGDTDVRTALLSSVPV